MDFHESVHESCIGCQLAMTLSEELAQTEANEFYEYSASEYSQSSSIPGEPTNDPFDNSPSPSYHSQPPLGTEEAEFSFTESSHEADLTHLSRDSITSSVSDLSSSDPSHPSHPDHPLHHFKGFWKNHPEYGSRADTYEPMPGFPIAPRQTLEEKLIAEQKSRQHALEMVPKPLNLTPKPTQEAVRVHQQETQQKASQQAPHGLNRRGGVSRLREMAVAQKEKQDPEEEDDWDEDGYVEFVPVFIKVDSDGNSIDEDENDDLSNTFSQDNSQSTTHQYGGSFTANNLLPFQSAVRAVRSDPGQKFGPSSFDFSEHGGHKKTAGNLHGGEKSKKKVLVTGNGSKSKEITYKKPSEERKKKLGAEEAQGRTRQRAEAPPLQPADDQNTPRVKASDQIPHRQAHERTDIRPESSVSNNPIAITTDSLVANHGTATRPRANLTKLQPRNRRPSPTTAAIPGLQLVNPVTVFDISPSEPPKEEQSALSQYHPSQELSTPLQAPATPALIAFPPLATAPVLTLQQWAIIAQAGLILDSIDLGEHYRSFLSQTGLVAGPPVSVEEAQQLFFGDNPIGATLDQLIGTPSAAGGSAAEGSDKKRTSKPRSASNVLSWFKLKKAKKDEEGGPL